MFNKAAGRLVHANYAISAVNSYVTLIHSDIHTVVLLIYFMVHKQCMYCLYSRLLVKGFRCVAFM